MYARIESGSVVELWDVTELPPLHPDLAIKYVEVPDGVTPEIGWTWDGVTFAAPVTSLEGLRAQRIAEVKAHALYLIGARIPALSTFEMVSLMAVLWDNLVNPGADPDLAYCAAVYTFAEQRIIFANTTATLQQLADYDVEADTWPA